MSILPDRRLVSLFVVLLILIVPGIAIAQTGEIDALGSPEISVYLPDKEVTPGTETTITLQLDNEGDFERGNAANREIVTTARGLSVDLDTDDAPIRVTSGTTSVGRLTESQPKTAEFDIEVPDSADPGSYEIDVDMEYAYTSKARNAPDIRPQTSEESKSITRTITIKITDDPRFRVTEVDSNLRVGEEGEITGEITNVGGEDATNVEVQFPSENSNIEPLETAVAVGDIEAGDAAEFRIPIEVGTEAEAVSKRFDLPVSFRDENGIRQTDDDPEFLVDIAPKRDAFEITPINASIEAGGSQSLDIEVTNRLDETVTDVEGKLFVDDPFDSSSDETFTTSLDPGETTTVTVDLSASAGATAKNYPVSMDFRYTDDDGDSKLSDSYRMAISVTEPEDDGGLPVGSLLVGLGAVAGVGAFLWRRNGGFRNP